jgi:outer membrane cobalamin receptor
MQRLGPLVLTVVLATTAATGAGDRSENGYAGRTLLEALQAVQSLGLRLIYSSDVVKWWMVVEEEPASSAPRGILDDLLTPYGLEVREGPGEVLFIVEGNGAAVAAGGIEGVVRTNSDHEPVFAARIFVDGASFHATTDEDGRFRITGLQEGTYDLVIKVPGLQDERFEAVTIRSGQWTRVTLDLEVVPTILEQVVVTPDRRQSSETRPDSGRFFGGDEIRARPSVGDDVHRAVAWQPGVASSDRSAEFSVRGGEPNEVLILFDGQELYDPFHLKDFQSFSGIIDSTAVGSAELFSEAFPAEYGDRMSGVLDLASSIPATPGSTVVSTSFMNSRFLTDGKFREGAGHWLVSARAWYPDAVVQTMDREDEGFSPTYYDLLGKAQVQLGQRTVLTGHVLAARDDVDFTDPDGEESVSAQSETRYTWLTLNSLWSTRVYSRTLFSYGRIQSERAGRVNEGGEFVASVDDGRTLNVLGFGQDWTFQQSESLLIKWGVSGKWLDTDYDYLSQSVGDSTSLGPGAIPSESGRAIDLFTSGRQLGGYIASQFRPFNALRVETGVRWDRQTYTGEDQVSPRVSLLHTLSPRSRIRAAWGHYYQSQGLHELQIEDGVTDFFPVQLAEHWTLGYEHEFDNGMMFRADAYLKEMSDLRPRYENLFNPFELLPEFEPDRVRVEPDRAEARGLDLTLARNSGGPLGWWASYSRSSIEDEIDGRMVPRSWDQPHAFRFGLNYRRGETWEMGLAGVYHTGWPTTSIGGRTVQEPDGSTTFEPVLGPRNDVRFPDYHRLDLRVSRHFPVGRGRLTIFAEITNLYDRDNVCCVEDVEFLPQPGGGVRVERENGFWLQRVPSLGLTWRFDH